MKYIKLFPLFEDFKDGVCQVTRSSDGFGYLYKETIRMEQSDIDFINSFISKNLPRFKLNKLAIDLYSDNTYSIIPKSMLLRTKMRYDNKVIYNFIISKTQDDYFKILLKTTPNYFFIADSVESLCDFILKILG